MLSWVIRGVLFFAGVLTGWFLPDNAPNLEVVKMVVGIFLIIVVLLLIIYRKRLLAWLNGRELPPEEDD